MYIFKFNLRFGHQFSLNLQLIFMNITEGSANNFYYAVSFSCGFKDYVL